MKNTNPEPTEAASLTKDEKNLLLAIALDGPISKEQLKETLSWGNSKLNACLARVKGSGFLSVSTQDKEGSGRRPLSFVLEPELGYFLGIQCDLAMDYFVVVDAAGKLVAKASAPVNAWGEEAEDAFMENVSSFVASLPCPESKIKAVGLSAAVSFNRKGSATMRDPSYTNDAIRPIIAALSQRFQVPVVHGRPQVLLCQQGGLRRLISEKKSFINIIITDNVGIAVFVNGESWLGQTGLSGDLGHIKLPGNELPCYCGAVGCLRTKVSYAGLCLETRKRLGELATVNASSALTVQDVEGPNFAASVERIVEEANKHSSLATGIVYDTATELGSVLATVVALFNPERLIVHSVLTKVEDIFAERVRAMIRKNCLDLYSRPLILDFQDYSPQFNAEGAAMAGRDEFMKSLLSTT